MGGSRPIAGLRDRKRERNRTLTAETAWRLFIERGYDNVTVADICAAAEIAPRTFHRYFASKDDVIAEPVKEMTGIVARHMTTAPASASDAEVIGPAMHELGGFVVEHADWLRALSRVVDQSAHLRATHLRVTPEREQELLSLRPGAPGWRRRLMFACATAAFRIWYEDYLRGAFPDALPRLDEMVSLAIAGFVGETTDDHQS
jgi:AcrR family transcriptional regulator